MQVENGYIWKVGTIGDIPIFDFHDYGRKWNVFHVLKTLTLET